MASIQVVILDSNILIDSGPYLRSANMQLLLSQYERVGITVCVPDLVIEEVLNYWKEAFDLTFDELSQAYRAYSRIGELDPTKEILSSDKERDWNTFEHHFRNRVAEVGIERLPVPATPHMTLALMDMTNRKPFGGKKAVIETLSSGSP